MPPPPNIFRKAALDRLASPEQLDQMLRVGSMRSWVGLLALLGTVAAAVTWGFVGKVDTDVSGQGVIVRSGGVEQVVSLGAGEVVTLRVTVGQAVQAGQIVATVRQLALVDEIEGAKTEVRDLQARRARLNQLHSSSTGLDLSSFEAKRHSLEAEIASLQHQAEEVRARQTTDGALLAKGLITHQQKIDDDLKVTELETSIEARRASLSELDSQSFHAQTEGTPEDLQLADQLTTGQMRVATLEHQLAHQGSVVSPYSGRVIEVKTQPGSMVGAGQPILSLQPDTGGLEAILYAPAAKAKQIQTGMAVEVSPTQLRREEFGYIKGKVTAMSSFPATEAALMDTFANESLVQNLMRTGPVVEVRVSLDRDPGTPSGFRWSSPHGAPVMLTPGTMVSCDVVVREQSPASLVVPYARKELGLR